MTDEKPQEVFIDVSEEEAPKPFEIVLEQIAQLKNRQYIRMLHRKKPLPLIQILETNGFSCRMFSGEQTEWEVLIWNKQDSFTQKFCANFF